MTMMKNKPTLELTLVKTQTYKMIPFGRFLIKWCPSKKIASRPHILDYAEVKFNIGSGMPYTKEQEKEFEKFMIRHKSDILTDERRSTFYTRIGDSWVEIRHNKLYEYAVFLKEENREDNEETWKAYAEEMSKTARYRC